MDFRLLYPKCVQISEQCIWSEFRKTISFEHLLKLAEFIDGGSSEHTHPWAHTPMVYEAGGKARPKHTPAV